MFEKDKLQTISHPKQSVVENYDPTALTLSRLMGQSKETFKTTIEVSTFELCNFSTIHSHGSILCSFESQEPQISFSLP